MKEINKPILEVKGLKTHFTTKRESAKRLMASILHCIKGKRWELLGNPDAGKV